MCTASVNTFEDLWQFLIWGFFFAAIYSLVLKFWNNTTYKALSKLNDFVPPIWLVYITNIVVGLGSSFAAWRIWSCGGWAANPVALFLYVLFIIAFSVAPFTFIFKYQFILNVVWWMIVFGLSITTMIYFFFDDFFAGYIMIAVVIVCGIALTISIYIAYNLKEFEKKVADYIIEYNKKVQKNQDAVIASTKVMENPADQTGDYEDETDTDVTDVTDAVLKTSQYNTQSYAPIQLPDAHPRNILP